MSNVIRLWVPGKPIPQGSKRAFVVKPKVGKPRAVVVDDNKDTLATYRHDIRKAWTENDAHAIWQTSVGYRVTIVFNLQAPKSMIDRQGAVKGDRRHTKRPDLDKLVRSVLDALTGLAWIDDSQVHVLEAFKSWCRPEDVGTLVTALAE